MKKIFVFIILSSICFSLLSADYKDLINEGIILLTQKKIGEAIKTFEKARNIKPSDPYPYYYLGQAYYMMGNKRDALDSYKKAIEIDGNNPDFYYALAQFYISEANYEEAFQCLDKVIEIAPSSTTGKSAKKLKESLQKEQEGRDMIQKWAKLEEEIKKQKERKEEKTVTPEGLPPEFAGMPLQKGSEFKEEKVPVEQIVKRIKFGRATVRQQSSVLLPLYEQAELIRVIPDMIDIIKQSDESTIRKNVIFALGRTETPEAIDTITKIIQDRKELYEIRITALDSISKYRSENITNTLRNTLKEMLDNREKERVEAQKNIKDITAKLETLEAQKIALNMQIQQEEQKRNEIMQKLQMSDIPPEFGAPGMPQPGGVKPLSIQEIQKLRTELLKVETSINKKREENVKIDQQLTELQQQRARYESLLRAREKKTDVIVKEKPPSAPFMQMGVSEVPYGIPGGIPAMESPVYEETSEDKNEVIFALKLIRALGSMRDKQGLSIIKKGWDEYGVESERIYYLLTLARLGEFTGIQLLVERLKQDYPQAELSDEIELRKGIIEVLGEYLVRNPDQKLQQLIEFLSEEEEHPEIKVAAAGVLASLTKAPAGK